MKQKLLRLAKKLNKFTLDDLVMTMEENSEELQKEIKSLLQTGQITKAKNNSYFYSESKTKESEKLPDRVIFTEEEIQKLIDERNTSEAYKNSPKYVQRKVDKYVFLLKETHGLIGVKLVSYIKNVWNKKHPDMKSSENCFYSRRKILKDFGIEGLIPVERNFTRSRSSVDEDLYQIFREHLLNNKNKSLKSSYEEFREKYFTENPEAVDWEFPGYRAINSRIKRELLQYNDKSLSEINMPKKRIKWDEQKKYGIKMFTEAAEDYINDLGTARKLKSSTIIHYKSCINNNLIPFFEKYSLEEITEDVIEKFRIFKREDHAFKGDICYPLLLLQRILNVYSSHRKNLYVYNCKSLRQDVRIPDKEEIKKALSTAKTHYQNFYPLLLTALLTGMTKGEILVLTWDKINWDESKIFVNYSLCNGKIKKHTVKNSAREIIIPEKLIRVLREWKHKCPAGKNNFVFPNDYGEIQDSKDLSNLRLNPVMNQAGIKNIQFIDLRDTYAALLIEQNFPLTYIQEQLGHNSVQVTIDRYKNLIDKNRPASLSFPEEIFA